MAEAAVLDVHLQRYPATEIKIASRRVNTTASLAVFALRATVAQCQPYAKCHEYSAGQAITDVDRGRPAQKSCDGSRRQNQRCEPNESEQCMYGAQQQDIRRHRDAIRNELREEGDVEYADLGI